MSKRGESKAVASPYYRCDYIECLRAPDRLSVFHWRSYYFCTFAHMICFEALMAGDFQQERHWAEKGDHAHMVCVQAESERANIGSAL